MTEPAVDQVRQTIADEWGSHLCYRGAGFDRTCDKDKYCRCADIARAILGTYTLTTGLASCLHPGNEPKSCQYEGQCLSVSCDHYGKTEYRPRMTVLARVDGVVYPKER